ASSHAAPRSSGLRTVTAPSPMLEAKSAYETSGRFCDSMNFGEPSVARISHVTWLRSSLCSTHTIRRGSAHSCQYLLIVMSSAMPFICMAPSPTIAIAGLSGCANFAPIAYGTPGPMDASVPDREPRISSANLSDQPYQFPAEPEY